MMRIKVHILPTGSGPSTLPEPSCVTPTLPFRWLLLLQPQTCSSRKLTKGTFHAKTGTIKDRTGMDLTEAETILRSGGKNTQKNYTKKILMTWIATMV